MSGYIERFQDWSGIGRPGRRKWIFVSISVALFVLGRIVEATVSLPWLRDVSDAILNDLWTINVINLAGQYYHFVSCSQPTEYLGAACSAAQLIDPRNWLEGTWQTFEYIFFDAPLNDTAYLVYLLAYIAGFAGAYSIYKRSQAELHLVSIALLAVGTFALGSVAALVMQVLGIVLFFIFGRVVGLFILLGGEYKWVRDVWKRGRQAHKILSRGSNHPEAARAAVGDILEGTVDPLRDIRDIEDSANEMERTYDRIAGWFGRKRT